jgi:hypothetical protein
MGMQICSHCATELDDRDIICASCGQVANATRTTPAQPVGIIDIPDAARAVVPPIVAAKEKNGSRNVMLVSAAVGAMATVMFIMRSPGTDTQTNAPVAATALMQATSRGVAEAQRARVTQPESTSAPGWRRTHQSQWATDGSRTIGFEVEAERAVAVYMDQVRPLLAVRCISRQTEVFVVLLSAPSIEKGSDTHTVRIALDDEPDIEQQWLESTNMQALFAPEGKALAARMATARHLRFAFKPFNAPAAIVEFDVHGFEGPLAAMSKTCAPAARRGPLPLG